jgi:phenylpyruvate tautomerase PptA (4-oxalocrotonate tautomerase family)
LEDLVEEARKEEQRRTLVKALSDVRKSVTNDKNSGKLT